MACFIKHRKTDPWRAYFYEGGSRYYRHFPTEREAKAFEKSVSKKVIKDTGEIPLRERLYWLQIKEAAKEIGWSPAKVTSEYLVWLQGQIPSGTKSIKVPDAVEAYLTSLTQRNMRPHTVNMMKAFLNRMVSEGNLNETLLSELKPTTLKILLLEIARTDAYRNTIRSRWSAFLNWCAEEHQWCQPSLMKQVKWLSVKTDKLSIGVYSPDEVRLILSCCPENIRFALAVCFFSGIRPDGELSRLRFENIRPDQRSIDLSGAESKIRSSRRIYHLPKVFWAWYLWEKRRRAAMRKPQEMEGKVLTITYKNMRIAVRKVLKRLNMEWPSDVTRHTFATNMFHLRGIEWTVDVMGHIGGFKVYAKHYKGLATPESARAFGRLSPRRVLLEPAVPINKTSRPSKRRKP